MHTPLQSSQRAKPQRGQACRQRERGMLMQGIAVAGAREGCIPVACTRKRKLARMLQLATANRFCRTIPPSTRYITAKHGQMSRGVFLDCDDRYRSVADVDVRSVDGQHAAEAAGTIWVLNPMPVIHSKSSLTLFFQAW